MQEGYVNNGNFITQKIPTNAVNHMSFCFLRPNALKKLIHSKHHAWVIFFVQYPQAPKCLPFHST